MHARVRDCVRNYTRVRLCVCACVCVWLPSPGAGSGHPGASHCLHWLCSPQRSPLLRGTGPGTADTPILAQSQMASKMLRLARESLADFLFPKWMGQRARGLRHIHAHTHREGKEQYNLKTACKSVKQISMAWISQIIEPQSITNIKCIWPWSGAQLKNTNGNLLGT